MVNDLVCKAFKKNGGPERVPQTSAESENVHDGRESYMGTKSLEIRIST
jgi:hypothetical protein